MFLLIIFLFCNLIQAQKVSSRIKLSGTVVAFEQSPWHISKLTSVEKSEVMIVRVNKVIKGKEQSKYIKVIYRYLSEKNALPEKVFSSDNEWNFALTRNSSCDNSIAKTYPKSQRNDVIAGDDSAMIYLVPTGSHDKNILTEQILPCYSLKSALEIKEKS